MSENDMVVEITIQVAIDNDKWGGWGHANSEVAEFIGRLIKPYLPVTKITSITDVSMDEDEVKTFERENA